jgi:antitoxin component YwqK of YwqJK toxin-antitoxin module
MPCSDSVEIETQYFCGYYSNKQKIYEHTFENGKFSGTRFFDQTGTILHELHLKEGG